MRTTVTLEPDVVRLIEERRKGRSASFKQIINDGLRQGLAGAGTDAAPTDFSTKPVTLGRLLIGSLDDVSETLDIIEGPARS